MHNFSGKWITNGEFAGLKPVNVFHRQLVPIEIPDCGYQDRHVLFRSVFGLDAVSDDAVIFITADDYFKLWINGQFVTQGPAPSYRFRYGYMEVNIAPYLKKGENLIAVHTLYQGLINRVWVSGDHCHGLLFDVLSGGKVIAKSDESVRVTVHDGFTPLHTVGYRTQFMESYDSRAAACGFERAGYDDSAWEYARIRKYADYTVRAQTTSALVFEEIKPVSVRKDGGVLIADFGSVYVGTLRLKVKGKSGDVITVRSGQELNEDGSVRYEMRANCVYEEKWILADETSELDQYDFKSFRYAELLLPDGSEVTEIALSARHYPFTLKRGLKEAYRDDETLTGIFNLCERTLRYGVQEVIQDCMDREKGFYVGDGCYSALAHLLLTDDDTIVRKLIDDAFASAFITDTLVTCLDCSHMQEIAEYPLMLISLILWHYRIKGDKEYLRSHYPDVRALLDAYKAQYEKDGLLSELDKWCVVEWPMNFRDGYDVDIEEGKVCHEAHIAINAYYVEAIRTANKIAAILGEAPYRDEAPLIAACRKAFYDNEEMLFRDGVNTAHKSFIGNVLALYAGLFPDGESREKMLRFTDEKGMTAVELFGSVPLLASLVRMGDEERLKKLISDENAWLRILREGGKVTFEGWGKDTKWNTSLFHLTLSFAAVFLADFDTAKLFE